VTVSGFTANTSYSQTVNSTSTLAASLASALNVNGSPVTASASGSVITITAGQPGSSSNYALSTTETWNPSFTGPSFAFQAPVISSLTGGADGSLGTTPLVTLYTYDALDKPDLRRPEATDTTAFTNCAQLLLLGGLVVFSTIRSLAC